MLNTETRFWWSSSSGRIELKLSLEDAHTGYHQGHCDADIRALSEDDSIASQLAALDPAIVAQELQGYGAWDEVELADHEQNLQRLLWIAAGDLVDTPEEELEEVTA